MFVLLISCRVPVPAESAPSGGGGAGDEASERAVHRLQAKVAELRAVKARRDAQFDQLAAVVEQRTDQFKRLIGQRHAEIETLQAQLRRATTKVRLQHGQVSGAAAGAGTSGSQRSVQSGSISTSTMLSKYPIW